MKRITVVLVLSLALIVSGCSPYSVAQKTSSVIGAVLTLAQSDLPSLESTGIIPVADRVPINAFLGLAVFLNGQLDTCITAAHGAANTKSAFLACYQVFSNALTSSNELAGLRVISPSSQSKVQLWITAIDVALTSTIVSLGGTPPASASRANIQSSPEFKVFEVRVKAYLKAHGK